jgi:hypothetical protein
LYLGKSEVHPQEIVHGARLDEDAVHPAGNRLRGNAKPFCDLLLIEVDGLDPVLDLVRSEQAPPLAQGIADLVIDRIRGLGRAARLALGNLYVGKMQLINEAVVLDLWRVQVIATAVVWRPFFLRLHCLEEEDAEYELRCDGGP